MRRARPGAAVALECVLASICPIRAVSIEAILQRGKPSTSHRHKRTNELAVPSRQVYRTAMQRKSREHRRRLVRMGRCWTDDPRVGYHVAVGSLIVVGLGFIHGGTCGPLAGGERRDIRWHRTTPPPALRSKSAAGLQPPISSSPPR